LAKVNRTYSVEEVASRWGVHRNTVREWIKHGQLLTVDRRRPLLILGRDLSAFLWERRRKNRRPCAPGQIYCVGCREPKRPVGDVAIFEFKTPTQGALVGVCPTCQRRIFRRLNPARVDEVKGSLSVRMESPDEHIGRIADGLVNRDLPPSGENQ